MRLLRLFERFPKRLTSFLALAMTDGRRAEIAKLLASELAKRTAWKNWFGGG